MEKFFDQSENFKLIANGRVSPSYGCNFYPWEECPVGKSFFVPVDVVQKNANIHAYARDYGRRNEKKFKVVKHTTGYEVGRVE